MALSVAWLIHPNGPQIVGILVGLCRWDYGNCDLNKMGRVTIPWEKRQELGLMEDYRLLLAVEGAEIRLRPLVRRQLKVMAGRKWGKEAFPKAGEATFAAEE